MNIKDTKLSGGCHVVILGAGASIASTIRDPEEHGLKLPSSVTGTCPLSRQVFNKSLLLSINEERGAYWIKKYEEVIKSFEEE